MASPIRKVITEQEYLLRDAASREKLEFHNGAIYAMAGAKRNHIRITDNVSGLFYNTLKQAGCTYYSQDLRVRLPHTKNCYYPDVVVVCGPEQIENETDLFNPTLIVEVGSRSTEMIDIGEKTANYRTITSLQAYLLISSAQYRVTLHTRQGDVWTLRDIVGLQSHVQIDAIGCTLELADIYDQVMLTQE